MWISYGMDGDESADCADGRRSDDDGNTKITKSAKDHEEGVNLPRIDTDFFVKDVVGKTTLMRDCSGQSVGGRGYGLAGLADEGQTVQWGWPIGQGIGKRRWA